MNGREEKSWKKGVRRWRLQRRGEKSGGNRPSGDQSEFDLKLLATSSSSPVVTADVHLVRSSTCLEATNCSADLPVSLAGAHRHSKTCSSNGCRPPFTSDSISRPSSDRSLLVVDKDRVMATDQNGFDSPIGTSASSGGARLKLPTVKMAAFLSRKKRSCPSFQATAMATEGENHSPTLSSEEQGMIYNNTSDHNTTPRSAAGGVLLASSSTSEVGESNPLLLRRLNNRLRSGGACGGRKKTATKMMTTRSHQPRATDFNGMSEETGTAASASPCQSFATSHYSHHIQPASTMNNMGVRLFAKEDPGPSNSSTNGIIGDTVGGTSGTAAASSSSSSNLDVCWGMGGKSSTATAVLNSTGTKYKLVKEGQIQVCRLQHPRTLIGKLASSKLLRRWECHFLILEGEEIRSKTPTGFMDHSIKYVSMEDVHALPQWDSSGDKYCVRIFVQDGSILLQTNRVYIRNQWLYSIQWRRNLFRYRRVIESNCSRPEVVLKELKCMVELASNTPLQGCQLNLKPVKLACMVLQQVGEGKWPRTMTEAVITCIAPLLDTIVVVSEIGPWLTKHCQVCPRSRIINDVLANVAILTLKKNMDFGKFVTARIFVQQFLYALSGQNDGFERIKDFVRSAHGPGSACPHPRILSNMVSVCLAAMHALYDVDGSPKSFQLLSDPREHSPTTAAGVTLGAINISTIPLIDSDSPRSINESDGQGTSSSLSSSAPSVCTLSSRSSGIRMVNDESIIYDRGNSDEILSNRLGCLATVFETMSEFEDWRLSLASILQPIPFPDAVLSNEAFLIPFSRLVRRVGADTRCDVHLAVLGVREGKEGWFHVFCPGGSACVDDGDLFASILKTLLRCCCRRKKFLYSLNAMLGPLQLLALRECGSAMEALCLMLEFEIVEGEDLKLQMITALQSTPAGKQQYAALCDRQIALRELQQKGGPRKLTLPSKSTDADLAVLLSSGSFGNLEWLSLAFTNVTSACAEYLIKLPSLRYLNFWSTQFGDVGLQMISEHLHKLQVLNLCETPVTDKGLSSLSALTNLRKLNLNSTHLSARTFQMLRAKLPALQEADVRYTDAWCADEFLTWP